MNKGQFIQLFAAVVIPGIRKREGGMIDKPMRQEAWVNMVDSYTRNGLLPSRAVNWLMPKYFLEA